MEAASKELRDRAIHKGIAIDELFRNKNGISMQLSKIEDLFMNREGRLSKAPQLFINTVDLYLTDKKAYDEILREARLMDQNNVMTQEDFFTWLSNKLSSEQVSELNIIYDEINSYCIGRKILKKELLKTVEMSEILEVKRLVESNKIFRFLNGEKIGRMQSAVDYYLAYVKEINVIQQTNINTIEEDIVEVETESKKDYASEEAKGTIITEENHENVVSDNDDNIELIDLEKKIEQSDLSNNELKVDFEKEQKYSFTRPMFITYFGSKFEIENWSNAYAKIAKLLCDDYPGVFMEIADSQFDKGSKLIIARQNQIERMTRPLEIVDGLYIEANRSATDIISYIKQLLDFCRVKYENVTIEYRETKDFANNDEPSYETADALTILENNKLQKDNSILSQEEPRKIIPIENLGLSVRSFNCLKRNNINNTEDLLSLSQEDLSNFKNMGKLSLEEVNAAIHRLSTGAYNVIKTENKNYRKKTVLHYVAEETLLKEVSSVLFQDANGMYVEDVSVEELGFSNRTLGGLLRAGCVTASKIINMKYDDLQEIRGMGTKSLDEIMSKLREITIVRFSEEGTNDKIEAILEQLSDDYSDYLEDNIRLQLLAATKTVLLQNELDKYVNDEIDAMENISLLRAIYTESMIKKILQTAILSLVKKGYFTYEYIRNNMPRTFVNSGIFDELISIMLETKEIENTEDGYCIYYPSVSEYIQQVDDEKMVQALKMRLEGKTFAETGNELGLTRERIRQIVKKALEKLPRVKEGQFKYWYENYSLDREDFIFIFNLTDESYNYINMVYETQGIKNIEDIFDDDRTTISIARRAKEAMKKYSVLVDGEYVPLRRDILTKTLLKLNFSATECGITEFYAFYNSFLMNNGIDNNKKLLYISEHALEARLADCDYILMKYGRRIRYYNIEDYDVQSLFSEVDFERYDGLEISTLKLFALNRELMDEYNIKDEYELHNLMKKCEQLLPKIGIQLSRMPFITIGTADRAKQVEEFLFRVAPIDIYQFGAAYEKEYGVKSETVLANFVQYIDQYYHNSMFTVDQMEMDSTEYLEMKQCLTDDCYSILDVEMIYKSVFPNGDIAKVNAYNLKKLGFLVYVDYVIRNTYNTADDYFRTLLSSSEEVNIKDLDRVMRYNQTFNKVLDDMRSAYELLEVEPSKYISFNRFQRNASDITKDDLREYSVIIPNSTAEKYFTIKFIRDQGIITKIDDLGYSDWFYGALLRANKEIRYSKMAGGFLFSHDNRQITRGDFFTYVVAKFGIIKITDFIVYIEDKYGLAFDRYDIPTIINSTSMYYSPITEAIYINKDMYYSKSMVIKNMSEVRTESNNKPQNDAIDSIVSGEHTGDIWSDTTVNTEDEKHFSDFGQSDVKNHGNSCESIKSKFTEDENLTVKENLSEYSQVLIDKFPKGYRADSNLDLKRFITYYNAVYGTELDAGDELTRQRIKLKVIHSGISYGGHVFAVDGLVSEETKKNLLEYLKKSFSQGSRVVYYRALFEEFNEEFLGQRIYDEDMLRTYLMYECKGKYIFEKNYLSLEKNVEVDPKEDITTLLVSHGSPMKTQEIYDALPHYVTDRIDFVLHTDKKFVCNTWNEYFHVSLIDLSDDELEDISEMIEQSINERHFISGNEMIKAINTKYPAMLERFPQFSQLGLRDSIAYYLQGQFAFNGNIISSLDSKLSMNDVFAEFAKTHERFTLDELNVLKNELNSTIYFDAVYENSLRVSKDLFVSKNEADFDVAKTDAAISAFCRGAYIPLSEVTSFSAFPYAGYPWNIFLLEHYVATYSIEYKLMHKGYNGDNCVGAIVKRTSGIEDYEALVEDVLTHSEIDLNKNEALQYLYDKGYIARRKYSGIEQILIRARAQKG